MRKVTVFDIETYRSDWRIKQTRREALDPNKNTIITIGAFDGKKMTIYPIIQDLKEERTLLETFVKKLRDPEKPILVGFNVLHFDIPYVVHKLNIVGQEVDMSQFKPLDLYWILPYWLQNCLEGRRVASMSPWLGRLWRFEDIVQKILGLEPNPSSNTDIFNLWETKRFRDIERHLERDLRDTFQLLHSLLSVESMKGLERIAFTQDTCKDSCPFRRPLQTTSGKAVYYCTLCQQKVSNEVMLSAIDIIGYPLPRRDVSWIPPCVAQ